ncbi:MAG: hypothetical protein V4692_01500 [Bdellovibrionota bacterium]
MIGNNERGAVVLPFAVVVSVVIVVIFMQATSRVNQVSKRYAMSQGLSHTQTIAEALAQKIRYAYDLGRAATHVPNGNPSLCAAGDRVTLTASTIVLCVPGGNICVPHPKDGHAVCVTPNVELTAKADFPASEHERRLHAFKGLLPLFSSIQANAAINYSPAEPPLSETSNTLNPPTCIYEPGGTCALTCGSADVDCLSFKFCPLTTALGCSANELVMQTVAFPKPDLSGI